MSVKTPSFLLFTTLFLLPQLSQASDSFEVQESPKRAVLLHLDACCPSTHWNAAEERINEELRFRNIQVISESASTIEESTVRETLQKAADRFEADAALTVFRQSTTHATIYVLTRFPGGQQTTLRSIMMNAVTKPDAAIVGALRAVDAVVADYTMPPRNHPSVQDKTESKNMLRNTPGMQQEAPDATDTETKPKPCPAYRFYLTSGGLFGFSSNESGVRSGFVVGAGLRLAGSIHLRITLGYRPFGPEIEVAGDRSAIDILTARAWAGKRFRESHRIRPTIWIGGGMLWVLAEGIRTDSAQVSLAQDKTYAGHLGAGADIQFVLTDRLSLSTGIGVGATFPRIKSPPAKPGAYFL